VLDTGDSILGNCDPGSLIQGVGYRFFGKWQDGGNYGQQFKFDIFSQDVPHSRTGVIEYILKTCEGTGIGTALAHQIVDEFGSRSAIDVLKSNPDAVADKIIRLSPEAAGKASEKLIADQQCQNTKIDLLGLLAKRGFQLGPMIDQCLTAFGPLAVERIKKDPFTLMVRRMLSAGFMRVDQLYCDLGLPQDRLKRQLMCAWHAMQSGMNGSTWFSRAQIEKAIGERVSGNVRAERAIELGVRAKVLSVHEDPSGREWIAIRADAENEDYVAKRVKEILC
jgi:hypothetical protein